MGHRHYNGLKTAALFGVMWAVLLGIGWLLGRGTPKFLLLFTVLGLVMTAYSYWNSDKIAIRAMKARPVSEIEQPAMYRIVRELSDGRPPADAAALHLADGRAQRVRHRPQPARTPPSAAPRASCRSSTSASCAASSATSSCTSTTATSSRPRSPPPSPGVITSLAQFALFFGGGSDRDRGGNPLAGMLLAILAPLAAMMVQLAITRTREFDADEDGARLTGDPLALASALRKLEQGTKARPLPQDRELVDVSHLMIANPFRGAGMARLFSTHPPMADRIARLEAQAGPRDGISPLLSQPRDGV